MMDEPEAALSPFRQMAMLARINQLVGKHSQFIIATHSPILMAYPDAVIYNLTAEGIERTALEETDHYMLMKRFINNRKECWMSFSWRKTNTKRSCYTCH